MTQKVTLSPVDYLLLLLVVSVGVTLGNLASSGIKLLIMAKGAEAFVQEMQRTRIAAPPSVTQPMVELAERARIESEATLQREKDQRATNRTGRELFRLCQEWTESHRTNNVMATREGMDYHCARYRSYVETGVPRPR